MITRKLNIDRQSLDGIQIDDEIPIGDSQAYNYFSDSEQVNGFNS